MPRVYGQATKISDAGGRSAYIKNDTKKQEEVVVYEDHKTFDWAFYHQYEIDNQHNPGQKQTEAREIMLPLPNELASKIKGDTTEDQKEQLSKIVNELASEILGENRDYEFAVHWNKPRTNLHCHILFSEREVRDLSQLEQKTYTKDIWQDPKTHKLCKKGEGELVHKKGDPIFKNGEPVYKTDPLTAKDPKFKARSFLTEFKEKYQEVMKKYGFDFDLHEAINPYLSQKKLFKGADPDYLEKAREWNKAVKDYNQSVRQHIDLQPQTEDAYIGIKRDLLENVREANREAKQITPKAIEIVQTITEKVKEKVRDIIQSVSQSPEFIGAWWNRNREKVLVLKKAREIEQTKLKLKELERVKEKTTLSQKRNLEEKPEVPRVNNTISRGRGR